jgi:hypothetical protein
LEFSFVLPDPTDDDEAPSEVPDRLVDVGLTDDSAWAYVLANEPAAGATAVAVADARTFAPLRTAANCVSICEIREVMLVIASKTCPPVLQTPAPLPTHQGSADHPTV